MQILTENPGLSTYSNEEGNFISGFLIGTKLNDAKWRVSPKTIHEHVQKFVGKDFAIIPELIQTPISQGGGGHYWGLDTYQDLLRGYAENSHGKYTKVLGPYSYNDGTDDVWYKFHAKLRDSKAAATLVELGPKLWVPFAHSPHIYPLAGPEDNFTDWEPVGGALVIKGAFGPQAVISKLCKGTAAQCDKSLGASTTENITMNWVTDTGSQSGLVFKSKAACEKDDQLSQMLSSLVSKSASSQDMGDNKADAAAPAQPQVTNLVEESGGTKPIANATIDSQKSITESPTHLQTPKVITTQEYEASIKEREELKKMVTELRDKDKLNTLNNLFAKVKDQEQKKKLIEKYMKFDNVDQVKEIISEIYPVLKASEEPEAEEDDEDKPEEPTSEAKAKATAAKPKSKGASTGLKPEPTIPKEETESKAASVTTAPNKAREINDFILSGGRYY